MANDTFPEDAFEFSVQAESALQKASETEREAFHEAIAKLVLDGLDLRSGHATPHLEVRDQLSLAAFIDGEVGGLCVECAETMITVITWPRSGRWRFELIHFVRPTMH